MPTKTRLEVATPSIRQALNKSAVSEIVAQTELKVPASSASPSQDQEFDEEKLNRVWHLFAPRYKEEVHLYNTLLNDLIKIENNLVQINLENSVQVDQIKNLKPEIIGYLRRELENQQIDLQIELVKTSFENKILTDDQKLLSMMSRNPSLMRLKGKFNLDFHG